MVVWSSPSESKYDSVASGSLSPTEIVADIVLDAEAERGLTAMRPRNLRGRVEEKESLEEIDFVGRRAIVERERDVEGETISLEMEKESAIRIDAEGGGERKKVR